jgi:hypothetical protein
LQDLGVVHVVAEGVGEDDKAILPRSAIIETPALHNALCAVEVDQKERLVGQLNQPGIAVVGRIALRDRRWSVFASQTIAGRVAVSCSVCRVQATTTPTIRMLDITRSAVRMWYV